MKKTVFADDFLESFRSKGRPQLSSVISPDRDPSLSWLSRHAKRHKVKNELCLTPRTRWGIRFFDIVFASIAILLLSPVFLILALLIKLESPGPVLYKQVRTGRNLRSGDRRRRTQHPLYRQRDN